MRIVLLGKTGVGKSSTGNTILGESVFQTANSPNSVTQTCESRTKTVNGREITVVDAPGFFDTNLPEEELKGEIARCIIECAPGPHAFLIVLRVGTYTEQEMETVKKIRDSFGEEALKYAVVLFTHGNQLSEDQTIEKYVDKSTELQDLVKKCGRRVHIIDNKYWEQQQDDYRSNRVQVENLLNTIEKMVKKNGGQCYTNEMLQMVNRAIEEEFKKTGNEGTEKDRRAQAKEKVYTKLSVRLVGVATGALVGALLGAVIGITSVISIITQCLGIRKLAKVPGAELSQAAGLQVVGTVATELTQAAGLQAAGTVTGEVTKAAGHCFTKTVAFKAAVSVVGASAAVGGIAGGIKGYDAAEGAETVTEAMGRAAIATYDSAKTVLENTLSFTNLSSNK